MNSRERREAKDETIPVRFTHVERHGRKTYRAGGLYLSLGGGPGIGHVAMRVDPGGKKWATTDDAAAAWLVAQGLPIDRAAQLVAGAIQARDGTGFLPGRGNLMAKPVRLRCSRCGERNDFFVRISSLATLIRDANSADGLSIDISEKTPADYEWIALHCGRCGHEGPRQDFEVA